MMRAHIFLIPWLLAGGGGIANDQSRSFYAEEAARLAAQSYAPGFTPPTDYAKGLSYDALQRIRVKGEHWIFNQPSSALKIEPRLAGSYNSKGIQLSVLKNGVAQPVPFKAEFLEFPKDVPNPGDEKLSGYSGFRVIGPARTDGKSPEHFTFGGGTYFRCYPEGLHYGLSARGLILHREGKEEFPLFERFTFEEPKAQSSSMVWHALMNSPSATGAFRFVSSPGDPYEIKVEAEIFLRAGLSWNDLEVGLAGFSSMYWFGPASMDRSSDFRGRVHDSEALAVVTTSGERFWRVLGNPRQVRRSSLPVDRLRGFGLIQRERSFAAYQDENARYESRTSAWVEPLAGLDSGRVHLLELPTRTEFEDNIAAYFVPETLPSSGQPIRVGYRILWCSDVPILDSKLAPIVQTRAGRQPDKSGVILLAVDFSKAGLTGKEQPKIELPPGLEQKFAHLKPLPDGKTIRLYFGVLQKDPKENISAEIRAQLVNQDKPASETWVYPWSSVANIVLQPIDPQ